MLAVGLVDAGESWGFGTADDLAVGGLDLPGQTLVDVGVQPWVRDQLRGLRALGSHVGLPLRHRRPVLELPAAGGRVAAQLTRHRSGAAAAGSGALAPPLAPPPEPPTPPPP